MKVADVYRIAIKTMKHQAKLSPNKTFSLSDGSCVSLKAAIEQLEKVVSWVFPKLDSDDIALVVHCKDCVNYRTYKSKKDIKAAPFKACSIDHIKREPTFYCAKGERKQ